MENTTKTDRSSLLTTVRAFAAKGARQAYWLGFELMGAGQHDLSYLDAVSDAALAAVVAKLAPGQPRAGVRCRDCNQPMRGAHAHQSVCEDCR